MSGVAVDGRLHSVLQFAVDSAFQFAVDSAFELVEIFLRVEEFVLLVLAGFVVDDPVRISGGGTLLFRRFFRIFQSVVRAQFHGFCRDAESETQ